jgi:hypothetical protein
METPQLSGISQWKQENERKLGHKIISTLFRSNLTFHHEKGLFTVTEDFEHSREVTSSLGQSLFPAVTISPDSEGPPSGHSSVLELSPQRPACATALPCTQLLCENFSWLYTLTMEASMVLLPYRPYQTSGALSLPTWTLLTRVT